MLRQEYAGNAKGIDNGGKIEISQGSITVKCLQRAHWADLSTTNTEHPDARFQMDDRRVQDAMDQQSKLGELALLKGFVHKEWIGY